MSSCWIKPISTYSCKVEKEDTPKQVDGCTSARATWPITAPMHTPVVPNPCTVRACPSVMWLGLGLVVRTRAISRRQVSRRVSRSLPSKCRAGYWASSPRRVLLQQYWTWPTCCGRDLPISAHRGCSSVSTNPVLGHRIFCSASEISDTVRSCWPLRPPRCSIPRLIRLEP